jgi:sulfur carrier protein
MILVINGQEREFPELAPDSTLTALVEALGLKSDRVAVERNGSIVSRADWAGTPLRERDRLEVVHFVGGGQGDIPNQERAH